MLTNTTHKTHSTWSPLKYPSSPKWSIDDIHQTIKTDLEREHSILLPVNHTLYVNQVCHGVGRCANMGVVLRQAWSESHGTALMGYLTISTNVRRYQTHHRWHFFLSGRQRIGAHALCVEHSPTAAALSTSFLLNHGPQQPRFRDRPTAAWVWVVSQKDWRNQRATGCFLAMHWYNIWVKNAIFVFPVLLGSAEAHVIWGDIVKRRLIAYFIGKISAKKYQNAFTCVKVRPIANQRWNVFCDTV